MMSIPYEIKQGYIGHSGQLVTLRRVTVAEGKAKGTEIIEVKTAGGLELDIPLDKGDRKAFFEENSERGLA